MLAAAPPKETCMVSRIELSTEMSSDSLERMGFCKVEGSGDRVLRTELNKERSARDSLNRDWERLCSIRTRVITYNIIIA